MAEEVLEQRRLSKQRVNAQRPESVDGQGPARKRGRPPIVVTDEVLEQRRLSRQRVNAERPKNGPSRRRGRPRGSVNQYDREQAPLSIPRSDCISTQGKPITVFIYGILPDLMPAEPPFRKNSENIAQSN